MNGIALSDKYFVVNSVRNGGCRSSYRHLFFIYKTSSPFLFSQRKEAVHFIFNKYFIFHIILLFFHQQYTTASYSANHLNFAIFYCSSPWGRLGGLFPHNRILLMPPSGKIVERTRLKACFVFSSSFQNNAHDRLATFAAAK